MSVFRVECSNVSGYTILPEIGKKYYEINNFSREFNFGNVYCIDSDYEDMKWIISWCVSGKIKSRNVKIIIDNKMQIMNKEICWDVGSYGSKNIFDRNKSIHKILMSQSRKRAVEFDENKICENFLMEKERLNMNFRRLSGQKWRASMLIGFYMERKVFCFPWMDADKIISFKDSWIKPVFKYIKENGGAILLPTKYNIEMKDIFDEVIVL